MMMVAPVVVVILVMMPAVMMVMMMAVMMMVVVNGMANPTAMEVTMMMDAVTVTTELDCIDHAGVGCRGRKGRRRPNRRFGS